MTKKDFCWLLIIVVCVSLTVWFYFMNKNIVKEQAKMDAFVENLEQFNAKLKNISAEDIAKYKAGIKNKNEVAKTDKKD